MRRQAEESHHFKVICKKSTKPPFKEGSVYLVKNSQAEDGCFVIIDPIASENISYQNALISYISDFWEFEKEVG